MTPKSKREELEQARSQGVTIPKASLAEADQHLFGALRSIQDTNVTKLEDGKYRVGPFIVTAVGMVIADDVYEIKHDDWVKFGQFLRQFRKAYIWLVADWLLTGERYWGDTYAETARALGFKVETMYTYVWIANYVDFSIRIETLDMGHHRLVAPLAADQEQQKHWLQKAAQGDGGKRWPIKRMKAEMLKAKIEGVEPDEPPPALSSGQALLDRINKRRFNRIWRSLEQNRDISLDDVYLVEKWLEEVKRLKKGGG